MIKKTFLVSFLYVFLFISCSEFEHSNPFDPEYEGENIVYEIDNVITTEYLSWETKIEYNLNIYVKYYGKDQVQLNGKILSSDNNILLTDSDNKNYLLNSGQTDKSNFPFRFELAKSISKPYSTNFVFVIVNTSTNNEWSDSLSIIIN